MSSEKLFIKEITMAGTLGAGFPNILNKSEVQINILKKRTEKKDLALLDMINFEIKSMSCKRDKAQFQALKPILRTSITVKTADFSDSSFRLVLTPSDAFWGSRMG